MKTREPKRSYARGKVEARTELGEPRDRLGWCLCWSDVQAAAAGRSAAVRVRAPVALVELAFAAFVINREALRVGSAGRAVLEDKEALEERAGLLATQLAKAQAVHEVAQHE